MLSPVLRKAVFAMIPLRPMISSAEIVVPYYHLVSDARVPQVRHIYAFPGVERFRRDLEFFQRHFRAVTLAEVIDATLQGKKLTRPSYHLTFDDGFRECHDLIAPILLELGIPATFFICSGFVDNRDMFFRNKISLILDRSQGRISASAEAAVQALFAARGIPYTGYPESLVQLNFAQRTLVDDIGRVLEVDLAEYLEQQRPYLTSEQVRALLAQGFTIGSHSTDHPRFSTLPLEDQVTQVRESVGALEQNFGVSCRTFAFPHSDAGVSRSFYRESAPWVDLFFGTASMLADCVPGSIQRFSMENGQLECGEIMKQNYLRRAAKRVIGKGTVKRRA